MHFIKVTTDIRANLSWLSNADPNGVLSGPRGDVEKSIFIFKGVK